MGARPERKGVWSFLPGSEKLPLPRRLPQYKTQCKIKVDRYKSNTKIIQKQSRWFRIGWKSAKKSDEQPIAWIYRTIERDRTRSSQFLTVCQPILFENDCRTSFYSLSCHDFQKKIEPSDESARCDDKFDDKFIDWMECLTVGSIVALVRSLR